MVEQNITVAAFYGEGYFSLLDKQEAEEGNGKGHGLAPSSLLLLAGSNVLKALEYSKHN